MSQDNQKQFKSFEDFKNLHEVIKTIRFELKPKNDFAKNLKPNAENFNIAKLVEQFQDIQKFFLDIFTYDKKTNSKELKLEFKKNRQIKYGWLRSYTKNSFYDWKKEKNIADKDKKYCLTDVDYLPKEFLRWINEWQELTEQLENFTSAEEHRQERKSDIAFVLRIFLKRQNFEFIKEFIFAVMDLQNEEGAKNDEKIEIFRKLAEDAQKNLKNCEKQYLPSQSNGLLLHKASLNYYTLNKTPKEYGDLRSEKEKGLEKRIIDCKNKWGEPEFFFDKKFNFGENPLYWTLDDAYYKIKDWKAEQKAKFNEAVAKDELTVINFRKKFPIFDATDENFLEFYRLTKELDKNSDKAKEIAQQRGYFFNKPKEKVQTKNYYELCELYKHIAMKRGKILAEIKGLENEKIQSQLLDHWAVIVEENGKHFAAMIPRGANENHKDAHKFLDQKTFQENENGGITLYHFKSLTLRALEKLCFKEFDNSFFGEIKKTNPEIFFPRYKEEWRKEEWKLIKFYKKILQSKYAQKYLDLVDFGGLQNFLDNTDFTELQKFESELEKVCYVKVPLKISAEQKDEFIKKFNAKVFEMTTRSIGGNKKENQHARIWKNFWSSENKEKNHITRLNPEMSIFYREALNAAGGNRNRYSEEKYTLATTITLNATEKKSHLAFKTTEDIKTHIDEFNAEFNKNFKSEWFYGIDRGLKELATVCVVKFSDKKNKFGVSEPEKFVKIEVWKLKDENADLKGEDGNIFKNAKGENRKIIDNISCLESINESLFEKQIVSCLDLTMAKLIKGKIVMNGDKNTYLKLKELSAKRRIFELFSTAKIDKNAEFSFRKTITVAGKKYRYPVYWLTEEQKGSQHQKQEIEKILKKYLNELDEKNKFEDIETIEKINHLRDAITANMVGILAHLQEKIGKGYISLENMDVKKAEIEKRLKENGEGDQDLETGREIKMIDDHFDQSNQDISRWLEWLLYRKFANNGAVPPQIKQSILLRDEFKVCQFGILKFVKIDGTSSNCPNCKNKFKKTGDHYVCEKIDECGFSSKENRNLLEQNLNNSDEVAAYNVVKNAFDGIYS